VNDISLGRSAFFCSFARVALLAAVALLKDMALDPQPFDMLRFAKYKENLRIELTAADLSTGTDIEEATRHTRSVTGKAL
jgi:hypothetical protein